MTGRSAPPRRRAPRDPRDSLPMYLLVLACCAGGFWWMLRSGTHGLRGGTVAVAGAMFIAAMARLVLPERKMGMLAARTRTTDVVTLTMLAAGLLAAGLTL